MIVEPRRGRFWVYIERNSKFEHRLLREIYGQPQNYESILNWLSQNVAAPYKYCCHEIFYRRGDDASYSAIRFVEEDDAVMFALKFSENEPKRIPNPPAWKSWPLWMQEEPWGETFEKYVSFQCFRANATSSECFWYSSGKNFAGFYLTWRTDDDLKDNFGHWARRRDAIAWSKLKAEGATNAELDAWFTANIHRE